MKKIVLTAAAVLAITGSAFAAGSDHYGSNGANQPAVAVDSSYTASIQEPVHADKQPIVQGSDRNLFGNR
ncbi:MULTISPECIES: DUF680 domain-containing protein [unclassified Mesorhizobium]|uniref:DUF680 domain-containing protein n=1 Tax=unclassified Mesorhizobium TaxID=325217 RepID=UPI000FD86D3C|nr:MULTISPECIES: DUF680 domain-containing protein [unclassified Mesorhizobium]TGQ40744.1 DUF680 domain-containing protein [Mesorhizobium sp. M00.F.Ca.ET.216.01.1.1]TIS60296.1 MAG: DUF680 domain-containing protein [Mesorhizobium sp.]TIS91370.1 MAG: DUF680 domain-containing protein [Mesorhizobium sp.]TJW13916.1 MAG: DUF680 domain-containing protein [Mesorhizobium sp.]TJW42626.1 MAG: DUF680 domain-containing protein [Mesorhizobium sp.]